MQSGRRGRGTNTFNNARNMNSGRSIFSNPFTRLRTRSLLLLVSILPLALLAACGEEDVQPGEEADTTAAGNADAAWNIEEGIGPVQMYTMTMTIDQTMEVSGEAMESNLTSDGTVRMRKTDSSADGVTWLAVMDMSMKGTTAGTSIPAMNQNQKFRYLVSPEGRIVSVDSKSEDDAMNESIQKIIQDVSEQNSASQFFLKEEWMTRTPGESWEETITDTIDLDSAAFMGTDLNGALDMRFSIRTRYTFRGEVDTLGMTLIRIDTETLAMTIDGTITAENMEVLMESDGTGQGTQYYDPATRLYAVGIAEQQMKMMIRMPSLSMTMPMEQDIRIVSVRGDLAK